jgi:hypothetical protein
MAFIAVVAPGRSEPRAAEASDNAKRRRSCAGFPMRPQIAHMAITTNPNRRPFGYLGPLVKPLIKLDGAATHIGMCGTGHFQVPDRRK